MMNPNYIFLQNKSISKRIPFEQLLYIRVEDYLLTCYLENGDKFYCCKSLKKLSGLLPSSFIQINRFCIINKDKIKHLEKSKRLIVLTDDSSHPVSHRRIKEVFMMITG